jgi:hypothetical protein
LPSCSSKLAAKAPTSSPSASARRPDGTGLFARAWAGVAQWEPAFDSVGAYVGAAQTSLSATYRGYEAAQDWFRGEGLNKPFVA